MLADAARDLEDDGVVVPRHQHPRLRRGLRRRRFSERFDIPYESIYDPDGQRCWRSTAPCRRRRSRASSSSTPTGRVAARVLGEIDRSTLYGVVEDVLGQSSGRRAVRRRRAGLTGRLVRRAGHSRHDAARGAGGAGRRARCRSSRRAWCRCCPATSPTRPGCPAPTSRPPRRGPDARRHAAVRARLHRLVRRPRHRRRRPRRVALRVPARDQRRARRWSRSWSGWCSWAWCRGCSATCGCTGCPPSGWPRPRCSGCCSRSAGRPASARRSPPCRGWRSPRAPPAAARCSASPTPSGSGCPFILLGLAYRRMLGAVRWVRRHQVWVTRVGGLMLVVVGLLLVTGWWDLWVAELRGWVVGFEVPV